MKNIFFLFFTAIVLASCCNSCDPINPPVVDPPVVIKQFTVASRVIVPGGTVTPSMQTVNKGGTATFKIEPYPNGYEIDYLKDNGNILPAMDVYTVRDVSKDDTFEVAFKKDSLLWPLLNITWAQDSVSAFLDGEWVYFGGPYEVVNFTSDGKYSQLRNGETYSGLWSLDKSKSPAILIYSVRYFTIEELTEQKMSIHYTNQQGIVFRFTYHNAGYKN